MKKKIVFISFITFAGLSVLFSGCQKDQIETKTIDTEEVAVQLKNGYLQFETDNDLKKYLNSIESNQSTNKSILKSLNTYSFKSINDLKNNLEKNKLKSVMQTIDGDEEMSIDEFNINKAEDLLKDPILNNVMDTTLRIGVDNKLYKITIYGTFIADVNSENKLNEIISDFENFKSKLILIKDNLYKVSENIYLIDTYKKSETNTVLIDSVITEKKARLHQKSEEIDAMYALNTYSWDSKTLTGKALSYLFGTDAERDNYFYNNKRIRCELFDVNYGFYTSTGFKVKMQKRKKFCGIKYWVSTHATKLAIGIEKLDTESKFSLPTSTIVPLNKDNFGTFQGTINDCYINMVFKGFLKVDFLSDWTYEVMSLTSYSDKIPDSWRVKMEQFGPKQVYSFLKGLNNKYIFNPIKKQIMPKDPRTAIFNWGEGNVMHQYTYGIVDYTNYSDTDSKTIRFNQSYGFKFAMNNGNMSGGGYTPVTMSIKNVSIFGAALYNDSWKGIRFVKY